MIDLVSISCESVVFTTQDSVLYPDQWEWNLCVSYSCVEERAFWVSWDESTIAVGKGSFPDSRMVDYSPEGFKSVTGVSVASSGEYSTVPAYWELTKTAG